MTDGPLEAPPGMSPPAVLQPVSVQRVVLPSRRRRLVLLAAAGGIGALLAYVAPPVRAGQGALLLAVVALVTGLSSLWSP